MKASVWNLMSIYFLKIRLIWTLREKGMGYSPAGLGRHYFCYSLPSPICQ